MKSIFRKNRRSVALSHKDDLDSRLEAHDNLDSRLAGSRANNPLRSLVIPAYDSVSVKHAWINAAINQPSPLELPDTSFRLYRAELKGSVLHLYRPPSLLNARLFRVGTSDRSDGALLHQVPSLAQSASTAVSSGNGKSAQGRRLLPLHGSDSVSVADTTSSSITGPLGSTKMASSALLNTATGSIAPKSTASANTIVPTIQDANTSPGSISYLDRQTPHPDLRYDSPSNTFLSNNSPEALVHHFLFAENNPATSIPDHDPVAHLIVVFPMLPNFSEILSTLHAMLSAIFDGAFGNFSSYKQFTDRLLALFDHVVAHFGGFILKKAEGSMMLKTLLLFDQHPSSVSPTLLASVKSKMLTKQQDLLALVNFRDLANSSQPPDPFIEISSSVFMNDVNLFDFAALITEIDLHFFKSWNSSTDKALLLSSLVANSNTSDTFFRKNPLVFNNDTHVHYLARLLLFHLFAEDTSSKTPQRRARILERWIDLGCLLDKSGNMSSWLGIASIVLSQPLLRLRTVWSYVNQDYIKLLRNDWSPVLFELDRRYLATSNESIDFGRSSSVLYGEENNDLLTSKESYHIMAPRGLGKIYSKDTVIPYFGDLLINNIPHGDVSNLEIVWKKVNYSFDRWNDYLKNLTNLADIINYNQDVLRRYNSMGFIVSNESLNQVLYLGANKEEKSIPSSVPVTSPSESKSSDTFSTHTKEKLRKVLLRLLELNEDPTGLSNIMSSSLKMEPNLPEKYLRQSEAEQTSHGSVQKLQHMNLSSSNLSVTSSSSGISAGYPNADLPEHETMSPFGGTIKETSAEEKLPAFNNNHFKIDLLNYDDLVASQPGLPDSPIDGNHRIVINNDLTLRVDDFVADFDLVSSVSSADRTEEDKLETEDEGLGIDVDDILNSEKFKNLSLQEDHREEQPASPKEKRHRSFGLVSNYSNNRASQLRSTKYIPRFAPVDTLIDLMLIDSVYFDERYPIELSEFRFVFLLNYSSFMSTKDLLDNLAHRFVHSGNAVISIMKKQHLIRKGEYNPVTFGKFPNWNVDEDVKLAELGDVDYELLLKIQVNILKALLVLLNNFYANFAHDLTNKRTMIKFFKLYTNEILQWYNSNKIDKQLDKYFEELVNYYKKLKKMFVKKTYRPVEVLKFDEFLTHEFRFSNVLHDVPMNRNLPSHKNVHKIEKFIHKFNKLLTLFYKGIKPEDWFRAFNILENQFENYSLLNYSIPKNSAEEQIYVSNIFSYFDSLRDGADNEILMSKFPIVFRKLFRLYHKFKCYLYIQLCDPNIALEERLDRMKTLLIMVKLSQLKMGESQFVFEGDSGSIPSCIESAIVNVIYHPASRQLGPLWAKASNSLNAGISESASHGVFKDINDLLPRGIKSSDMLMVQEPLLPCFGWIFELLLEVNKCPNFHNTSINFNKRYLIYKLIKELSVEDMDDTHLEAGEFDFLLKLDESLCQSIKIADIIPGDRHKWDVFGPILKLQQLINEAELAKTDGRIVKSLSGDQNPRTKKLASSLRRQSLNYKTNASSRFKISGLFNRLNSAGGEKVVDYRELPDPSSVVDAKSKPLHSMLLKDYKIFPVYLLPNCLKVDSDSGDVLYLRTPDEEEMRDWSNKLAFANRHWFHSRLLNYKCTSSMTTFSLPLETICSRDRSKSPLFLDLIYEAIETEGLHDVGIYRISTSISELSALKQEIDRTGTVDLQARHIDVHALTSCVKLYFRELPDAILTDDVIRELFQLKADNELLSEAMTENGFFAEPYSFVLKKLPRHNFYTLRSLIRHLSRVASQSEHNKMTASNLATVIGPALTEASSAEALVSNFGFINFVLEKLIDNWDAIFNHSSEEN